MEKKTRKIIEKRRGPWSAEDKQYIRDNYKTLSHDEIAEQLGRNVDAVQKYIEDNFLTVSIGSNSYDIKKSIVWKDVQRQFDDKEQEVFLYHWNRMINQFQNDVSATEQLQIVDMIKLELLMNRCLSIQRDSMETRENLRKEILDINKQIRNLDPDDMDAKRMYLDMKAETQRMLASVEGGLGQLTKDYDIHSKKKNEILKALKATREQRYEKIKQSKEQFSAWMANLIEDVDVRREMGQRMEKMRIATEVEFERLSTLHKYEDGVEDFPFYNPEVALREKAIEDQEIEEEMDRIKLKRKEESK